MTSGDLSPAEEDEFAAHAREEDLTVTKRIIFEDGLAVQRVLRGGAADP